MPKQIFNMEKYASYDEISKKSTCLVKTCQKQLSGKLKSNIKRHYKLVHQQDIESDDENNSEDVFKKEKKDEIIKLCCEELDTKKNIPVLMLDDQEHCLAIPKKKFNTEKYASYDEISKKSTCLVKTCQKQLSGKLKSNIKRHYKLVHKQDIESDSENNSEDVYKKGKKDKINKLNTTLDKNSFLKCCLGLVTKKNIPFRIFDDQECFKQLIAPYEQIFNINLNSSNIGAILENASSYIKAKISDIVKTKMICMKIDTASRLERNVLGINIQYIRDYRICINTIGMVQITKCYTAANLKKEILKCLKEYNIEMRQIYSKTTDNGANVLNVSQLLQEMQQENTEEEEEFEVAESSQIESHLESVLCIERCAAHAIQLAANDVIKTLTSEIEECRKIAKNLRTSVRSGNDHITLPCLDVVTSWNSTYDMINKIFALKEYIENLDNQINSDMNWPLIQNFLKAFEPFVKYTMKLQREQYILGDFFRDWLTCELELEELVHINTYAAALLSAMRTRKEKLLKHDAFTSAIYLDPRFNFSGSPFLTSDLKKSAVEHLITVHEAVNKLTNNSDEQEFLDISSSSSFTSQNKVFPATTSAYNILDDHIQSLMGAQNLSSQTHSANIKHKLLMLCERERAALDTNVLEYWEKSRDKDNDMRKIVETVLAVPATQASVSRSFSALSTILTKLRSKISKKILADIFITKFNYELLNFSNFDIEYAIHTE